MTDHQRQRGAGHDREQDGQLVELPRERRLLLLDAAQHPGDLAHLGVHPGRGDDHLAPAARHGRVHVGHVEPVAERDVRAGYRVDRLQDRRALAGERGFLDLQRRGHEQATVRGNLVARLEGDDVSGNELLRGDLDKLAVAADMSSDHEHLLQRGDALGRLALLIQAQDGIEDGQPDDDEAGSELLEGDHADDRRAEQDELHQVAVLAQERPPAGLLLRFGELVRAELLAPPLDFGGVETASARRRRAARTPRPR